MRTRDRVKQFIVNNYLFGDGHLLQDQDSFREKGLIDSTGILELISFLESEFSIQILDNEIIPENLDSIERVTNYVMLKVNDQPTQTLQIEY